MFREQNMTFSHNDIIAGSHSQEPRKIPKNYHLFFLVEWFTQKIIEFILISIAMFFETWLKISLSILVGRKDSWAANLRMEITPPKKCDDSTASKDVFPEGLKSLDCLAIPVCEM